MYGEMKKFCESYLMARANTNIGGLEARTTLREAVRAWHLLRAIEQHGELK